MRNNLKSSNKPFTLSFANMFNDIFPNQFNEYNRYPPLNIYKDDTYHFIELAVSGFSKDEIKVWSDGNSLKISGKKSSEENQPINENAHKNTYLYRGIGMRSFEKEFVVSKNLTVDNISLDLGILRIRLKQNDSVKSSYYEIN